jgi:Mn2+/Fe2+ NRAMP family transporter
MAMGLNLLFWYIINRRCYNNRFGYILLLFLINKGKMEAFIIALVLGDWCFYFRNDFAQPVLEDVMQGLIPTMPSESTFILPLVIGATVMPHNLPTPPGTNQEIR